MNPHESEFECDICYKSCKSKSGLTKHWNTHFQRDGSRCEVCREDFQADRYFVDHLSEVHMQDVGLCDICDAYISENPANIKLHFKVHHGKLRPQSTSNLKCPCSKCVDISKLKNTSESKVKNIYRCDMCEIDFTDNEDNEDNHELFEHLSMSHMKDIDQCNIANCRAYIGEEAEGIKCHFKKRHGKLRPLSNGEKKCKCSHCMHMSKKRKKRKQAEKEDTKSDEINDEDTVIKEPAGKKTK